MTKARLVDLICECCGSHFKTTLFALDDAVWLRCDYCRQCCLPVQAGGGNQHVSPQDGPELPRGGAPKPHGSPWNHGPIHKKPMTMFNERID